MSRGNEHILRALDEVVLKVRPGAVLFILLFRPLASGVHSSTRLPAPDFSASIKMCDFRRLRGSNDGLGLAARDCYVAMGGLPASVRITGGAAHSDSMRMILAACLNCPVSLVAHDETGAAGAAMIAAVSIGLYSNMAECARRWIEQPKDDIVNPDSALARTERGSVSGIPRSIRLLPACGAKCMPRDWPFNAFKREHDENTNFAIWRCQLWQFETLP